MPDFWRLSPLTAQQRSERTRKGWLKRKRAQKKLATAKRRGDPGGVAAEEMDAGSGGGGELPSEPITHPPKKTVKAYKLFRKDKGKLYPLFIEAKREIPVGVWLSANVGSKSGFALRPGWHAGSFPAATHIGSKYNEKTNSIDTTLKKPTRRPPSQVWALVEMSDDVDWQSEANRRASKTKNGEIHARTAHITDQVPYGGHYRYKTNPNQIGQWLIGGEIKVLRELSSEEVKAINDEHGVEDLPPLPEGVEESVKKSRKRKTVKMSMITDPVLFAETCGYTMAINRQECDAETVREILPVVKRMSLFDGDEPVGTVERHGKAWRLAPLTPQQRSDRTKKGWLKRKRAQKKAEAPVKPMLLSEVDSATRDQLLYELGSAGIPTVDAARLPISELRKDVRKHLAEWWGDDDTDLLKQHEEKVRRAKVSPYAERTDAYKDGLRWRAESDDMEAEFRVPTLWDDDKVLSWAEDNFGHKFDRVVPADYKMKFVEGVSKYGDDAEELVAGEGGPYRIIRLKDGRYRLWRVGLKGGTDFESYDEAQAALDDLEESIAEEEDRFGRRRSMGCFGKKKRRRKKKRKSVMEGT